MPNDDKKLIRIYAAAGKKARKKFRNKLEGKKTPYQKTGTKASEGALNRTANKVYQDKYMYKPKP